MIRKLAISLLCAGPLLAAVPTQRVGLPLEIREIYIPGGEVKPKPRHDREPPLVVRMLEVKPAKDGFRYDFEVQGLEAGPLDLADFLEAPAGTTIPAIPLEITSALPPGLVYPNANAPGKLPELGGYRNTMISLAAIWVAGLAAILFWRKKKTSSGGEHAAAPQTLAERLRPLVEAAAKGDLSTGDRARLERLVIGHWRERMPGIATLPPAEAVMKLRADPEASPLVLALERWLHARNSEVSAAEIDNLLASYR